MNVSYTAASIELRGLQGRHSLSNKLSTLDVSTIDCGIVSHKPTDRNNGSTEEVFLMRESDEADTENESSDETTFLI